MKKLLLILVTVAFALTMLPSVVSADCPPAEISEWWCRCCYDVVKTYRVSYFDAGHDWVNTLVEVSYKDARVAGMSTRDYAADTLGLKAGYNCNVGRVILPR